LTKTNATETRHYYYDVQWRPLEERVNGASVPVDRQYTWGLRDRWDLLCRKRFTGPGLLETLFVLRDYLDPVAIVRPDGQVVERYAYDAFGVGAPRCGEAGAGKRDELESAGSRANDNH